MKSFYCGAYEMVKQIVGVIETDARFPKRTPVLAWKNLQIWVWHKQSFKKSRSVMQLLLIDCWQPCESNEIDLVWL